LWHNFSQSTTWHKSQPVEPNFQRELTAKKIGNLP
jgi:hypothetical protein